MADTVLSAPPFILVKPKLTLGATGSQVEYECSANNVDVAVDQDENTVETFCGTFTSYKPEVWTITVTVLMSYGTAGFWNTVRPLVGTVVPFTVLPDATAAPGPDNPQMTGNALVKAFPFVSGAVGEASEVDFVLAVQGAPTWVETLTMATNTSDTATATDTAKAA